MAKAEKVVHPWLMNHTCMRLQRKRSKRSSTRTRLCWQKSAWQLCLTGESVQRSCVSKKQPSNIHCTQMSGSAQNRRTAPFLNMFYRGLFFLEHGGRCVAQRRRSPRGAADCSTELAGHSDPDREGMITDCTVVTQEPDVPLQAIFSGGRAGPSGYHK